jgi:dCMP deaminase
MNKWDARFVGMAFFVASWSKDPDRKSGAILVSPDFRKVSVGFNGLPKGVLDSQDRLTDRKLKNKMTVHAELNAIFNSGFAPAGCTLYSTYFPCHECAKGIIQTGVARLVSPRPEFEHPRWGESWDLSMMMITEASLQIDFFRQMNSIRKLKDAIREQSLELAP